MLPAAQSASASTSRDVAGNRRGAAWLWLVVALGAGLRLVALGYKSFWIDEIASVAIARRATPVFWHFLWHDEGNMAAYYVLLRPWLRLGYGEGTVRLLSVIPGVLSIPLMYLLARSLFGLRSAKVATLFLALNACAISISQEARAYSFVVLAVLVSTYLFVRLIERPTYLAACTYGIVAGLSCYIHYFCVLIPAAHYVALAGLSAERRPWKRLVIAGALIAVLAAPILWLMHVQDTGHISWVGPPSWLELYHLGAYLSADSGKAVGAVLLAINLVLLGLFVPASRRAWRDEAQRWQYLLAASLLLTPIAITLLVSIVRSAFYHRFLVVCLPGWILMTALGALEIRRIAWRVTAIVAVCCLSLASTLILYHRVTEDWRNVVSYLIAKAQPQDRVLYFQGVGEFAGESYRDWLPGGAEQRPKPIAVAAGEGWAKQVDDAGRVWLVLYRAKPADAQVNHIEQQLEDMHYSLRFVSLSPGVSLMEFVRK